MQVIDRKGIFEANRQNLHEGYDYPVPDDLEVVKCCDGGRAHRPFTAVDLQPDEVASPAVEQIFANLARKRRRTDDPVRASGTGDAGVVGSAMIPSARYAFAVAINVLLPMEAYRLALGHYGVAGALLASMVPLLFWLCIDLARFRHFDALSAIVLAGLVMSWSLIVLMPVQWLFDFREPAVSGVIGAIFLVSLISRRPIVYYLARSTMSRERQGRELEFDAMWRSRPALVRSIRLMTAVWGIGLVAENIVRFLVLEHIDGNDAQRVST